MSITYIAPINEAPIITTTKTAYQTLENNTSFSVDINASDEDGGIIVSFQSLDLIKMIRYRCFIRNSYI